MRTKLYGLKKQQQTNWEVWVGCRKWLTIRSDCDSQPAFSRNLGHSSSILVGEKKKNADNVKGVERAEQSMMKDLKYYATEEYLQPGWINEHISYFIFNRE